MRLNATRSGSRLNGVYAKVFTICHNRKTVTSIPEYLSATKSASVASRG
jgi:hypothetical protein